MLVRHNTKLLEQAIDLQIKRSAIPTLQAEADAHDKIVRANAFRRMASGAAIALAAIGIGVGVWLVFDRDPTVIQPEPPVAQNQPSNPNENLPKETKKSEDRISGEETIAEEGKTDKPKSPSIEQPTPPPADPANPDTFDFVKFANRKVPYAGSTWQLESGHHFESEKNPTWDTAWCYTRRLANTGVEVQVSLVNRPSPTSTPQAPVSSSETLASVGLDDNSARELASRCLWLDEANFAPGDFDMGPERKEAAAAAEAFSLQDGWDAIGNDLPGMPAWNVSLEQCQAQCEADRRCLALTYDKKHAACFMKNNGSILVRSPDAVMAAKGSIKADLQYSSLVFAKDTVVVGGAYANVRSNYADCVVACAADQRCLGFNFDGPNKMCAMLDTVTSSSPFKGVASGVKATRS
ncbi:PAN domain-containing protein [Mesorhizobium sp. M0011]|uniref:PAN domain-containing protein n=1 Tax=Mesorhizobium sp. M0011 TaxID=2956839 RepID=UPI0033360DCF